MANYYIVNSATSLVLFYHHWHATQQWVVSGVPVPNQTVRLVVLENIRQAH